ncbi:hypothetical protein [Nitrosovibrio tenuis]|uniref:hypothetical protein n=1 Tax=Nitrosovibrio tenuis TaxID=1233 RepID=UPI0015A5A3C6|nr:hypothetical protein [Nitrosovibrio tenuis]
MDRSAELPQGTSALVSVDSRAMTSSPCVPSMDFLQPRDHRQHVMGPKPVYDEYVNGILSTTALPADEDPLAPSSYDGRVAEGPGIDYNYEITQYRFETPGMYLIQWRPGILVSNTLRIKVTAGEAVKAQKGME